MNVSRTRLFTRYGTFVFLLAVFAAGTLYWPALAKHSQRDVPVRNYGVIWAHQLTRSGLPDSEGWIWLRQQGVRSIVTFRTENDVDYWALDFEHVMHIPISGSVMPTETQTVEFLKFIQAPANRPVHIHCTAGRDRTGMMTALARYSIDGWTLENALSEARQYRDGKDLSARRIAWLRAWAKEHPPGAFKVTP